MLYALSFILQLQYTELYEGIHVLIYGNSNIADLNSIQLAPD